MSSTTAHRRVPEPEELDVKHEIPGYPGLYVKRTREGGATLYARWSRRRDADPESGRTYVVGGVGPYLNQHDPYGYGAYEDVVDAVIANVEHWFGWPHRYSADDLERARTWTEESDR